MTDIVRRLRLVAYECEEQHGPELWTIWTREAADVIERLRDQISDTADDDAQRGEAVIRLEAERDRLTKELDAQKALNVALNEAHVAVAIELNKAIAEREEADRAWVDALAREAGLKQAMKRIIQTGRLEVTAPTALGYVLKIAREAVEVEA